MSQLALDLTFCKYFNQSTIYFIFSSKIFVNDDDDYWSKQILFDIQCQNCCTFFTSVLKSTDSYRVFEMNFVFCICKRKILNKVNIIREQRKNENLFRIGSDMKR